MYAVATAKGLQVIEANEKGIKHIQTHLNSKDIKCVAMVKANIVLIGFFNSSDLTLYNLSNSCTLQNIPNPSKDKYVWRIIPLKNYSFLISDQKSVSIIDLATDQKPHTQVISNIENPKKGIFARLEKNDKLTIFYNET